MGEAVLQTKDMKVFDQIIKKHADSPGKLLSILEEAQQVNPHKYLPKEVLEYIAKKTGVPLSKVFSVITFYSFFNLKPQGEHCITICRGTACHTKGSLPLYDLVKSSLDFEEGDGDEPFITTKDNQITLRTVACFGQCALAPVVEVDGEVYGHITTQKMKKLLDGVTKKKASKH